MAAQKTNPVEFPSAPSTAVVLLPEHRKHDGETTPRPQPSLVASTLLGFYRQTEGGKQDSKKLKTTSSHCTCTPALLTGQRELEAITASTAVWNGVGCIDKQHPSPTILYERYLCRCINTHRKELHIRRMVRIYPHYNPTQFTHYIYMHKER